MTTKYAPRLRQLSRQAQAARFGIRLMNLARNQTERILVLTVICLFERHSEGMWLRANKVGNLDNPCELRVVCSAFVCRPGSYSLRPHANRSGKQSLPTTPLS